MRTKMTQISIISLILVSLMALPAFAQDDAWINRVKEQYGDMTITCAFVPHPTTDAFQAMVDEFTQLTGIKVRWDIIEEGYLRQKLLLEHEAKTRCV